MIIVAVSWRIRFRWLVLSIRIGRFEVKLRNTGERSEFAVLDKDGRLVRRECDQPGRRVGTGSSFNLKMFKSSKILNAKSVPTAEFAESLSRIRPSDAVSICSF